MEQPLEMLKRALPTPLRIWLRERRRDLRRKWLLLDRVTDFSKLRRVEPYRRSFGWHRGKCIDRYYIEEFLSAHEEDVHGHVLEVGSDEYTRRFGELRVTQADIIDLDERNAARTITADLTRCDGIGDNTFDCIICTQTLPFIYDVDAVVRELHRILKPGGVILASLPGIAKICEPHMHGAGEDYWRFTAASAQRLFARWFAEENVSVTTYGNVLSAIAFLHGLVAPELTAEELDHHDPEYQVTVAVRARKAIG